MAERAQLQSSGETVFWSNGWAHFIQHGDTVPCLQRLFLSRRIEEWQDYRFDAIDSPSFVNYRWFEFHIFIADFCLFISYGASSQGMFGNEFPGDHIFTSNTDFEDQFAVSN